MERCLKEKHDLIEIYRTSNFCHSYSDEIVINWCKKCGEAVVHIDHDTEKEVLKVFTPGG